MSQHLLIVKEQPLKIVTIIQLIKVQLFVVY